MQINWRVRFKNKAWLISFIGCIVAFVYQMLGLFGVVPPVSSDTVTQWIGVLLNILVVFGIIQDPTTAGMSDSTQAMTYDEPKASGPDEDEH